MEGMVQDTGRELVVCRSTPFSLFEISAVTGLALNDIFVVVKKFHVITFDVKKE